MQNPLIGYYQNGNYVVKFYSNGTKIKQTNEDKFIAKFPDSIDLKITDYCDKNCPMCHEKSSILGLHGDLNEEFLKTLKRGTELAIGGGNPLSHPNLEKFLKEMKARGVICSLTVNGDHLIADNEHIEALIKDKLIYGLGISIQKYNQKVIDFAQKYQNAVLHLINGVFTDFNKLFDKNLKILILGYKKFGKGEQFFSNEVENNMLYLKNNISTFFNRFNVVSFDNLALSQLHIKNLLSKEEYESIFMGDDGDSSMYIDLVKKQFAKSSTSVERYPLGKDIFEMFSKINNNK
ncbi:MAG: radical SAM protein [Clostridia bacterium]|nr:radical SAM protein [Clostridia bacterium]